MVGAGVGERTDRLDMLPHHRHGRPSIKRFSGSIPVPDDAMHVADDDAFGRKIGQPHGMRRGKGGLVATRRSASEKITHLTAHPVDRHRASRLRGSARTPDDERGLRH